MSQLVELPIDKITIEISDDMRLVPKDASTNDSLVGRTWRMQELREWCGNKDEKWVRKNILANPKYRDELKDMERDHTLIWSNGPGSPWRFKANVMAEFLDRHWSELPW